MYYISMTGYYQGESQWRNCVTVYCHDLREVADTWKRAEEITKCPLHKIEVLKEVKRNEPISNTEWETLKNWVTPNGN